MNSLFGPTSTAYTPPIPTNPRKRAFFTTLATTKLMPSPPTARKFSTKKCCLSPRKPKWSSGFATPSIPKLAAHASVLPVRSDIRKQRHSIPSRFFRFQLNKVVRHEFLISKQRRSKHAGEAIGEKV